MWIMTDCEEIINLSNYDKIYISEDIKTYGIVCENYEEKVYIHSYATYLEAKMALADIYLKLYPSMPNEKY